MASFLETAEAVEVGPCLTSNVVEENLVDNCNSDAVSTKAQSRVKTIRQKREEIVLLKAINKLLQRLIVSKKTPRTTIKPKRSSLCWNCGERDHLRRNCLRKECFFCREPGHDQKNCYKKLEDGPSTSKIDVIEKEQLLTSSPDIE